MIPVSEIWPDVIKIVGKCDDDVRYRKLNRAIEILANKSDWEPLLGFMDISCEDSIVTLPSEIETPLTISYGTYPALGRDQLYHFHLNGPGDKDVSCGWRWWQDKGEAVTFRELCPASAVAAVACSSTDVGKELRVYGYDANNVWVRTQVEGVFEDGYPVTIQANADFVADPLAPVFSRITRVSKPVTDERVELWTVTGPALDTLTAIYNWDETEPRFRRIRIDRSSADLVRIHYRRRNLKLRSQSDLIPLHSAEAVVMMVRSLKYYDEVDFANATACEATAVRWLTEEQFSRNPTLMAPVQVSGPKVDDDYIA